MQGYPFSPALLWRFSGQRYAIPGIDQVTRVLNLVQFVPRLKPRCPCFGKETSVTLTGIRKTTSGRAYHSYGAQVGGTRPAAKAKIQQEHKTQVQNTLTSPPLPLHHPPQTPRETSRLGTRTPRTPPSPEHHPLPPPSPPPSPLPRPIPTPQHRPLVHQH